MVAIMATGIMTTDRKVMVDPAVTQVPVPQYVSLLFCSLLSFILKLVIKYIF